MLQMGVFKKASGSAKQNRRYRLFSVVEHIGDYAHKGHYVCYSLDSNNKWMKFDDKKVSEKEYRYITSSVQAYMLLYELIQEEE
jgi:ubiquitin C-terminal hydrolase